MQIFHRHLKKNDVLFISRTTWGVIVLQVESLILTTECWLSVTAGEEQESNVQWLKYDA